MPFVSLALLIGLFPGNSNVFHSPFGSIGKNHPLGAPVANWASEEVRKCSRTMTLPGFGMDELVYMLDGEILFIPDNDPSLISDLDVSWVKLTCWNPQHGFEEPWGVPIIFMASQKANQRARQPLEALVAAQALHFEAQNRYAGKIEDLGDPRGPNGERISGLFEFSSHEGGWSAHTPEGSNPILCSVFQGVRPEGFLVLNPGTILCDLDYSAGHRTLLDMHVRPLTDNLGFLLARKCRQSIELPEFGENEVAYLIDGELTRISPDDDEALFEYDIQSVEVTCWNPEDGIPSAAPGLPVVYITTSAAWDEARPYFAEVSKAQRSFQRENGHFAGSSDDFPDPSALSTASASIPPVEVTLTDKSWAMTTPEGVRAVRCFVFLGDAPPDFPAKNRGETVCQVDYTLGHRVLLEQYQEGKGL